MPAQPPRQSLTPGQHHQRRLGEEGPPMTAETSQAVGSPSTAPGSLPNQRTSSWPARACSRSSGHATRTRGCALSGRARRATRASGRSRCGLRPRAASAEARSQSSADVAPSRTGEPVASASASAVCRSFTISRKPKPESKRAREDVVRQLDVGRVAAARRVVHRRDEHLRVEAEALAPPAAPRS